MEIISNLRNWLRPKLVFLIFLLQILTLAICLACGTLSILFVKNLDGLYLSIRHTELLKSINKSVVKNVHYICKDEQPTSGVNLYTWMNFGLFCNQKKTIYQNLLSIQPFIILPYETYTANFTQSFRTGRSLFYFSRIECPLRQSVGSLTGPPWIRNFLSPNWTPYHPP